MPHHFNRIHVGGFGGSLNPVYSLFSNELAGSASVGLTNNPVVTNSMLHSETSPNQDYSAFSHPSEMASFHLRLPETPRNTPRSHHHHHIHRSLMQGVIIPDVLLNHVSVETENKLYLDSTGPDGKPRADRFAVLLFKRLIPLNLYQTWAGSVNFDGSRGKYALPNNLRQALSDAVGRRFNPAVRDWKLIRDRLNELLRNRRTTFPLFKKKLAELTGALLIFNNCIRCQSYNKSFIVLKSESSVYLSKLFSILGYNTSPANTERSPNVSLWFPFGYFFGNQMRTFPELQVLTFTLHTNYWICT